MKNKMPLDGLGLGHDSGSVHCDMLKMLCFRTAWGGGKNRYALPLKPTTIKWEWQTLYIIKAAATVFSHLA